MNVSRTAINVHKPLLLPLFTRARSRDMAAYVHAIALVTRKYLVRQNIVVHIVLITVINLSALDFRNFNA